MRAAPNYYNEFDPYAAAMLRNLITAGHIADGVVDTRSIEDVRPSDLVGFTQCHFFAGVGVWSYALRAAGWPDDRPVWTGSCPCQPFSAAGEGLAFADERHLWPAFGHLIQERRPSVVLGEQVASKAVDAWIDLVHADLERMGYAFGSVPFPAAGVGAPHIRDRNYWVGHAGSAGLGQRERNARVPSRPAGSDQGQTAFGAGSGLGDCGELGIGGLGNPTSIGRGEGRLHASEGIDANGIWSASRAGHAGPTNGFWCDVDWIGCRDGKWRPVEPGTFPLAHGAAARVGRLRAYGNAVNASAATAWIEVVMESIQ